MFHGYILLSTQREKYFINPIQVILKKYNLNLNVYAQSMISLIKIIKNIRTVNQLSCELLKWFI